MSEAKPSRPMREPEDATARGDGRPGSAASRNRVPEPAAELPPPAATAAAPPVAERASEPPRPAESSAPDAASPDEFWAAFGEVQAALARGAADIAVAMTGLTASGVTVASKAAVAILGAKTIVEAVEINATLARRGADALIESSARMAEIGATAMIAASRPVLSRIGVAWGAATG